MTLWVDFETRSACDLKAAGVYNYAQDASTEVLCMSYAFGEGDVQTWLPSQPFPEAVRNHTGMIYAHKSYGKIYTPVFELVEWVSMDGEAPEVTPEPEAAPARRRRSV